MRKVTLTEVHIERIVKKILNEQSSMEKPTSPKKLYDIMISDYKMDKKVATELADAYKAIIEGDDVGAIYSQFEKRNPGVTVPAAIILRLLQ